MVQKHCPRIQEDTDNHILPVCLCNRRNTCRFPDIHIHLYLHIQQEQEKLNLCKQLQVHVGKKKIRKRTRFSRSEIYTTCPTKKLLIRWHFFLKRRLRPPDFASKWCIRPLLFHYWLCNWEIENLINIHVLYYIAENRSALVHPLPQIQTHKGLRLLYTALYLSCACYATLCSFALTNYAYTPNS
jgi:hypothetical protein